MARLVRLKDRYQVAFANDTDADRHGIVTPSAGLMNPNHYLSVAILYLLGHRPHWSAQAAIGKTVVSSSMIDRVVHKLGRRLSETPVGFKWVFRRHVLLWWRGERRGEFFAARRQRVDDRQGRPDHGSTRRRDYGPLRQRPGSALPCTDGGVRDGLLRAHRCASDTGAEVEVGKAVARGGQEPSLGGEPIVTKLTDAPGNGAPIGGLKVVARSGWFAARPSGTEAVYKIYAESFKDEAHLDAIVSEAQEMVNNALSSSPRAARAYSQ